MAVKIEKKIKGYQVISADDRAREAQAAATPVEAKTADVIQMHERLERPDVLIGSTYKIKTPLVEHAMYVTINDIVLNAGTEHEQRRPFEVFINSKSMDHFQWIVGLTRIMSAVFRKGGDVTFLVDEIKAGGVYMPSLVAEIGAVVEDHLKSIGMIHDPELSEHQKALIAEKRAAYERASQPAANESVSVTGDGTSFPPSATMCHKCSTKALVLMDGCATCLNCGYSKCG